MKTGLLSFASFFLLVAGVSGNDDQVGNLREMDKLHMDVNTSDAGEITPSQRLDLSDIMELRLLRGKINLQPYVANEPKANIPLVELRIDTSDRVQTGDFKLVLEVRDHVTIDRNGEETIAKTYEMERSGGTSSGRELVAEIKDELRPLVADFVDKFRSVNPHP